MNWWRRLAENRLLDAGAVVVAVVVLSRLATVLPAAARQNDFAHYYISSRLLWEGRDPYATPLAPLYAQYGFEFQERVPRATNPPGLLWLFAPVAALPATVAFWTWTAVESGALVLIFWLTWRLLGERLTRRGWFFFCAAVVTSGVVYWHFYYAQVQLVLALLVLAGLACLRSGKPWAACVAVTVAGLVKLYPLALLPWFIWRGGRDAKQRLQLAGGCALVAGALVGVMGPGLWLDFAGAARPLLADNTVNYSFNFTLPSLLMNLAFATEGFAPASGTVRLWWQMAAVVSVAVLAWAYVLVGRKDDREAEFGLLSVAMLAGSLMAWGHYQVFLIFPMAVMVTRVVARPTRGRLAWVATVFVLLSVQGTVTGRWLDRHLMGKVLANYLPLYGMLALAVFFVAEPRRRG